MKRSVFRLDKQLAMKINQNGSLPFFLPQTNCSSSEMLFLKQRKNIKRLTWKQKRERTDADDRQRESGRRWWGKQETDGFIFLIRTAKQKQKMR